MSELNPDIWVMDAFTNDEGDLELEFSDGHESIFTFDQLRSNSHEPHDRRGKPRLISHFRAGHDFDSFDLPEFASESHGDLLESVARWGAAIVSNVSTESDLALLSQLFGGTGVSEVLAERELTMSPSTNEPFRHTPPGLLVQQCIDVVDTAGEVILVDGFGIAADLQDDDPDLFDHLAETSIPFLRDDGDAHLLAHGPVISLDRDYEVAGIRFDETSVASLDLDPGVVGEYYRALIAFAAEVNNPGRAVQVRLTPANALVVENHRVLHSTSGFGLLRSAVIDRDLFHGQLRCLRRDLERPNLDERLPQAR